jgi:GlpG protein
MRQIGSISSEQAARQFVDFLLTLDITALTEKESEQWLIWVRDENQLPTARAEIERFLQQPEHARYRDAERQAETLRQQKSQRHEAARKNTVDLGQRWRQPLARRAPLAMTLIVLCVLVGLASGFGDQRNGAVMRSLGFVEPGGGPAPTMKSSIWVDIRAGQVWRVVTPIFLHYGLVHVVFNLIWLYYLGTQIEARDGTPKLAALVLVTAVLSNVAQALAVGPLFGGMSGVVYGLFGYVWMKMLLDPAAGYHVSRDVVAIMVVWLFLGFSGVLDKWFGLSVANWAHGGGMFVGMAIGFLPRHFRRAG